MATVNDILRRVYGFRGLPFPAAPTNSEVSPIAEDFRPGLFEAKATPQRTAQGTALWGTNALGRAVFMPATLGGYTLQNPLVTISGEKEIIETDVTEVRSRSNPKLSGGTVFEKVFQKPYDITIICTLINENDTWPEAQLIEMKKLFTEGTLYTLNCAITDLFLQTKNNFILQKIDLLDMQGVENAQVVQLTGRSNIDFELEIL